MRYSLLLALLTLACCGPKPDGIEEFDLRNVTLPGGQVIRAEAMMKSFDITRGMMYRTSLAPDRGMLFIYQSPDHHYHWMYQTLIPLDMIWMDSNRYIVEMVDNAQPCKTQASQCPQLGGKQLSKYVLEIPAGMAKKFGLQVGQQLQWF